MGKKHKKYDVEGRFARCRICDEEIRIEFYMDPGDLVTCEECDSEYIIKSRNPMILSLIEEEDNDDYNDYFDEDDYFSQDYN